MRLFQQLVALLLSLAAFFSVCVPAQAQVPRMEIHVHAALQAESLRPAAGSNVTLAISMRPDPGWHGYWVNPGDAGSDGITLDWQLPAGAKIGAIHYPMPETLIISGFMNYVYKQPYALLVDLTLPKGLAAGTKVPVRADANWLACTDSLCVPQQGQLAIDLIIGDGAVEANAKARFDAWRAALPVPLDRGARYAVDGRQIALAIPYPAAATAEQPYFFPQTTGIIAYAEPQKVRRVGDWLIVETALAKSLEGKPAGTVEGLLRYGKAQGLLVAARQGEVPAGGIYLSIESADTAETDATSSLALLLLAAVAGGLILNIMPCVFPILGLKAVALAKAGGDERGARSDALAYAAGVIASCVALGGLMLALRAGGEQVGWAFQLQEPGFVLFLLLLMVGVTANLAGLFELRSFGGGQALAGSAGRMGSFWTGVLAALVATPCTGPFMAAALGAALLLPATQALLLFSALGLGIALPFLAIAYIPALRMRLPKPGPWLGTFRKAMAVPMGLTAFALSWLLWRLSGFAGLSIGMACAISVLAVAICLGRFTTRLRYAGLIALAACTAIFATGFALLPAEGGSTAQGGPNPLRADAFSETRLATLRQSGTPVFVYFTADWCISCKVNEAAVLEREEMAKFFAGRRITVLRGDFTRQDPAIARFLYQQKAAGIPLYLYYPKNREAVQLPQILTADIVRKALAE